MDFTIHTYIHRIPELIRSKHFVALKFKKTTDAKGGTD